MTLTVIDRAKPGQPTARWSVTYVDPLSNRYEAEDQEASAVYLGGGALVFYGPRNELVVAYAPGGWDNVIRVETEDADQ